MAARLADSDLRTALQQQVFNADKERLIICIPALQAEDKKRSTRYLCLVVRRDHAYIYVVKQDKKTFRKKSGEGWPLALCIQVNGKCLPGAKGTPVLEFDLMFQDQKSKSEWIASSTSDKNAFFVQMFKMHRKYTELPPLKYVNLDDVLEDELARADLEMSEGKDRVGPGMGSHINIPDREETLTLSQKEQEDFEHVFKLSREYDYSGSALIKALTEEMSQMESANVHDLMNTHNDIENICRMIDQSLDDLNKMDTKISKYSGLVGDVSDQVSIMDETGHKLKIQNKNIKKLIQDISIVLDTLEFNNTYRLGLMDGNLMEPAKLAEIMEAANNLTKTLKATLPVGFEYHPAVIKQKRTLENLKKTFGNRATGNLGNIFIAASNRQPERREDLLLPSHVRWYQSVQTFSPVVQWLKNSVQEPPMYQNLLQIYTEKLGELYKKEQTEFFDKIKARINWAAEAAASKENAEYWLGCDEEMPLSVQDFQDYRAHLEPVRVAFHQVARSVIEEQTFLVNFFHVPPDNDLVSSASGLSLSDGKSLAVPSPSNMSGLGKSGTLMPGSAVSRVEGVLLRTLLRQLFKGIDEMLSNVLSSVDKANKLNCFGLMVIVNEIYVEVEPMCPYLSKCFGGLQVLAKRNFDNYVREQVQSILNAKIPKRMRFGPLPFVSNFESLARLAEFVYAGSQRRIELDRAYKILLEEGIFEGINRTANHKDCKVPAEVVFLENYHRLSDILSRLKIASLEETKTEVRKAHNNYRLSYVQGMLGKPLEKVQVFFDGVDAKIQTAGIKAHEVGFTTQFSKVELRKVLAMYTKNVVKKGLEQLYRKVEKQLSEEENMLQAVWRDMQQEFIDQYKNYLRLIDVCYPSSQIIFTFGVDDILKIFEEIAASH